MRVELLDLHRNIRNTAHQKKISLFLLKLEHSAQRPKG